MHRQLLVFDPNKCNPTDTHRKFWESDVALFLFLFYIFTFDQLYQATFS